MLPESFRRVVRSGAIALFLAVVSAGTLSAQNTGKIQGRVTDKSTGEPISGAQVTVVGSTLGNITNDQGFYFINNVPAGLHDVKAQFIGYRAQVIADQRILSGQTTTLNFGLEQTAVELQAITVQGQRNPLVPRDQTVSKAIVTGETVDKLPLDNASSIVTLQPGVVETNQGRTIRGSRPNEEAVYINGVLTHDYGTGNANPISLPTNALEEVDVITGAFSAEYSEAQSGVVNYTTKTGGQKYSGSLDLFTDQLQPNKWRTNFNRLQATFGGPIAGPLTFFVGGTMQGNYASNPQNFPTFYVQNGVDICPNKPQYQGLCQAGQPAEFALPVDMTQVPGAPPGAQDYVNIAAPSFRRWTNGRTYPYNFNDQYNFLGNLQYQFAKGSRVTVNYTRDRSQNYGRGTGVGDLYRSTNYDGSLSLEDVLSLGGYFVLAQSANQQIALDLRGSYQQDVSENGILDPQWAMDHRDPSLGFSFGNVNFLVPNDLTLLGFDVFNPSDAFLTASRSGAIPADSLTVYPGRRDLSASQAYPYLSGVLRSNPYGLRVYGAGASNNVASQPITGLGNGGLAYARSRQWQGRATLDWQLGRFNRIKLGGEYLKAHLVNDNVSLYGSTFGSTLIPESAQPTRAGGFLQDRLDLGDVVLEAGVRWDYLNPDVSYPRIPGFVFVVPDSLKKGFVRQTTDSNGNVVFEPLDPACNGASVCKSNFVDAATKSTWSPRLSVSFPVTPTSTFRLSYGRFVQVPAFFTGAGFRTVGASSAAGTIGFLQDANTDLTSGDANTNTIFARDVRLPSTRQFEFGYRQLIGQDLVVDVSAYNKKSRDGLTVRKLQFPDPTIPGRSQYLNVITNSDFSETNGFDVKVDKAVGNLLQTSVAYSFVDARGTGSDPFTYTTLFLRNVSNLASQTNQPENPPETLLPLEQSRTHTISATAALSFPQGYHQGSAAGAILNQLGIFATLRVASGLPFTPLTQQRQGQIGPPTRAGLEGTAASVYDAERLPWEKHFDIRITKGFRLGGANAQVFADFRNPFNLTNLNRVFLETGRAQNAAFKSGQIDASLRDQQLDGSSDVKDFDIRAQSPENDFNKYMLLRAEQRFGNGDGVFTVAEQQAAFGSWYEVNFGAYRFQTSDQNLRLGMRFSF